MIDGPVILTAGLDPKAAPAAAPSKRKAALAEVRRVMRDPNSTDADVEDALEALVELARDTE